MNFLSSILKVLGICILLIWTGLPLVCYGQSTYFAETRETVNNRPLNFVETDVTSLDGGAYVVAATIIENQKSKIIITKYSSCDNQEWSFRG